MGIDQERSLASELAELRADRDAMAAMLLKLEWQGGDVAGNRVCPCCCADAHGSGVRHDDNGDPLPGQHDPKGCALGAMCDRIRAAKPPTPAPAPAPVWPAGSPSPGETCRGCSRVLRAENLRVADGCPCTSPRGVNHGLVPVATCTCVLCDPEQTGSTRYPAAEGSTSPGDSTRWGVRHPSWWLDDDDARWSGTLEQACATANANAQQWPGEDWAVVPISNACFQTPSGEANDGHPVAAVDPRQEKGAGTDNGTRAGQSVPAAVPPVVGAQPGDVSASQANPASSISAPCPVCLGDGLRCSSCGATGRRVDHDAAVARRQALLISARVPQASWTPAEWGAWFRAHPKAALAAAQGMPRVAGAWTHDDADEYRRMPAGSKGSAAASVIRTRDGKRWEFDSRHRGRCDFECRGERPSSDAAKSAADTALRAAGWALVDDDAKGGG